MTGIDHVEMQADGSASVVYAVDEWGNSPRLGRYPGADISDLPADMQAEINAVWTPDFLASYALAQSRAQTLSAILVAKQAALAGMTYTFGGTAYRITLTAQDQIDVMGAVQRLTAAPVGATIPWEIVNGAFVTFGLADVQTLYGTAATYIQDCYTAAGTLTAEAMAAADQAALAALDIEAAFAAIPGAS